MPEVHSLSGETSAGFAETSKRLNLSLLLTGGGLMPVGGGNRGLRPFGAGRVDVGWRRLGLGVELGLAGPLENRGVTGAVTARSSWLALLARRSFHAPGKSGLSLFIGPAWVRLSARSKDVSAPGSAVVFAPALMGGLEAKQQLSKRWFLHGSLRAEWRPAREVFLVEGAEGTALTVPRGGALGSGGIGWNFF